MNENLLKLINDLMESKHSISDNPSHGYHGTIDTKLHVKPGKDGKKPEGTEQNAKLYAKMHKRVREITGAHPQIAKHYLDSTHGRHLADVHNDNVKHKLTDNHITNYIKKDFDKFKKHYKPELFESELLDNGPDINSGGKLEEISKEALRHYIKTARDDVEKKHKEGKEDEEKGHYVASAASHYLARKRAQNVGRARIKLNRKEGRPLDENQEISEMFPDSGSQFKVGDRVIVKNPSSPMNNKRGTYAGTERGRHVVKHSDGARSFHGDGVLLKESRSDWIKALVKEETKSADKKSEITRTSTGKLVTRMVTRKTDVVDSGGKDGSNETENK